MQGPGSCLPLPTCSPTILLLPAAGRIASVLASRGVKLGVIVDEGASIQTEGFHGYTPQQPVAMIGVAEKGYLNVRVSHTSKLAWVCRCCCCCCCCPCATVTTTTAAAATAVVVGAAAAAALGARFLCRGPLQRAPDRRQQCGCCHGAPAGAPG